MDLYPAALYPTFVSTDRNQNTAPVVLPYPVAGQTVYVFTQPPLTFGGRMVKYDSAFHITDLAVLLIAAAPIAAAVAGGAAAGAGIGAGAGQGLSIAASGEGLVAPALSFSEGSLVATGSTVGLSAGTADAVFSSTLAASFGAAAPSALQQLGATVKSGIAAVKSVAGAVSAIGTVEAASKALTAKKPAPKAVTTKPAATGFDLSTALVAIAAAFVLGIGAIAR